MGKTVVNSEYQEDSHYFTNRIVNSKPASVKMNCFHMTLSMLLSIAILFSITFQEASASKCHPKCRRGQKCVTTEQKSWCILGLCWSSTEISSCVTPDSCRTDRDCPWGQECLMDFNCKKFTGKCEFDWYCQSADKTSPEPTTTTTTPEPTTTTTTSEPTTTTITPKPTTTTTTTVEPEPSRTVVVTIPTGPPKEKRDVLFSVDENEFARGWILISQTPQTKLLEQSSSVWIPPDT